MRTVLLSQVFGLAMGTSFSVFKLKHPHMVVSTCVKSVVIIIPLRALYHGRSCVTFRYMANIASDIERTGI